nr:hypothetical protein [Mesorhizobium loti]
MEQVSSAPLEAGAAPAFGIGVRSYRYALKTGQAAAIDLPPLAF